MRVYSLLGSILRLHDHNLRLGNWKDDDEDDSTPKFDNPHTDYPEESQSSAFVRLMF